MKKEKHFLYKIPGKPTSKRITLVRVIATNIDLDKM